MFYPDLIDRQETPKYYLEKADHPGFAILRFHAGPPYEDIAFKVPQLPEVEPATVINLVRAASHGIVTTWYFVPRYGRTVVYFPQWQSHVVQ